MSETGRSTGNKGSGIVLPDGPISGPLHMYLIEIGSHLQKLPKGSFEDANRAFKGAIAELDRVSHLERNCNVVTNIGL